MDAANESPYNAYQRHITGASTPKELFNQGIRQRPNLDDNQAKRLQDQSLGHLEIMRQKLLEEKKKQITLLKQQELQRLRGVKMDAKRSDSSQLRDQKQKRYSAPPGNMHEILNFSNMEDGYHQQSKSSFLQSDRYTSLLKENNPDHFEFGDQMWDSVNQQNHLTKRDMHPILQYDDPAESNSGNVSSANATGTGVWRHRPYSVAVMECSGEEFSHYTESESTSDKENHGCTQTGALNKDFRARHQSLGALVAAERDPLLLRTEVQV